MPTHSDLDDCKWKWCRKTANGECTFFGGVGVFYLDTNLVVWFFVSRERALIRETLAYYISVAHLS